MQGWTHPTLAHVENQWRRVRWREINWRNWIHNRFKPITMQEKIIAAIAAYLDKSTVLSDDFRKVRFEKKLGARTGKDEFCNSISTEIAAAIAPLVEVKDYPYNELFDHMVNEHGLTLTNTELGDIIHIARCK